MAGFLLRGVLGEFAVPVSNGLLGHWAEPASWISASIDVWFTFSCFFYLFSVYYIKALVSYATCNKTYMFIFLQFLPKNIRHM